MLYIDGEMSRRLFRDRIKDYKRRAGGETSKTFLALSHEDIEDFKPLNTKEGQACIERIIEKLGSVDLIVFESMMGLIQGSMREEEPWAQTLPWIKSLTRRSIGQIWIHHTEHDETRGYGDKTREWQLDTVVFLTPDKNDLIDIGFTMEFRKARDRTPQTRDDSREVRISLADDKWTCDEHASAIAGKPKGKRRDSQEELAWRFLNETLLDLGKIPPVNGRIPANTQTVTLDQWRQICADRGLTESGKPGSKLTAFNRAKEQPACCWFHWHWREQVWMARQT